MIIQVVRMRRWTWANMQFINQNDTRIYSPSVGNPLGGLFYPGKRGDKALRLEEEELLCWEFSALKKKKKSKVLVLQWIFLRNVMSVFSLCSVLRNCYTRMSYICSPFTSKRVTVLNQQTIFKSPFSDFR